MLHRMRCSVPLHSPIRAAFLQGTFHLLPQHYSGNDGESATFPRSLARYLSTQFFHSFHLLPAQKHVQRDDLVKSPLGRSCCDPRTPMVALLAATVSCNLHALRCGESAGLENTHQRNMGVKICDRRPQHSTKLFRNFAAPSVLRSLRCHLGAKWSFDARTANE